MTRISEPGTTPLWLGLDTGGTYTDAVLLADGRRVLASAKALTTPWDLALGIGEAMRRVLARLPVDGSGVRGIELVSVSTTLATNAIVENRHSPVCTLLIGFDAGMVTRSGLDRGTDPYVCIAGGHDAAGDESTPLDAAAVERAVREHAPRVEAFAVAANFSVRNPAHELRARHLVRRLSPQPVTCAHELTSRLDAPRRALTAALNARLAPQIRHLIEALSQVLAQERIAAPLMIVKGDGSLMSAAVALEYPVETILSGPAASVVGAGFLTGLDDFVVADMGGTTTDVAVVAGGQPVIRADGALVGGFRTMVKAVDVRTSGLGGDSEVRWDRTLRLSVGPRKAMPLSLMAHRYPGVVPALRALAALDRLPDYPTLFAFRTPHRAAPAHLSALELRVWEALQPEPQRVSAIVRNGSGLDALRRLADGGLATLAAFTPSDALHVLDRQHDWNREAAVCGARVLAAEERNARALRAAEPPEHIAQRTCERVLRDGGKLLLAAVLAHDPGIEPNDGCWGVLGDKLVERVVAGEPFSRLLRADIGLAHPLIGIGAPAGAYFPEVARRLGATLTIPPHADVCNAVGAVAGVVSQTVELLVNQPTFNVFRVHDPAGPIDYADAPRALEHARRVSRELALAAAQRAGAVDPHVETRISERRALGGSGADYLAEAVARSTATGRPVAARLGGAPETVL